MDFERIPRPTDLKRVFNWMVRLPRDIRHFIALFRIEQPDVVHVNGAFFVSPAIAAKLVRRPLVWHLNDTMLPRKAARLFGVPVRLLADKVVASASEVALHYSIPPRLYEVLYPPVDVEYFKASPPEERDLSVQRIGLVGNWNPVKGLEYFVRAAAQVRKGTENDVEIVFAGARLATHADYARKVDRLIEDLGLRSVVTELGFVNSIAPVLKSLDVVVSSSTSEAAQSSVIEATAAGVPVVTTDVAGAREVLLADPDEPAGIVVEPRNPEAIAAAVLELLRDPEKAARMGRSGRRLAEERFSLEICARRHLEVYEAVVSGRAKRGAAGQ